MIEYLELIFFSIFVALLTGYAILDGFDLGVGMVYLFAKKDEERRLLLNSIGPVWDGNEVWLVTAGGALFAGFPAIYATICSSFYTLVMALLSGLIFRAVAIEFRSKEKHYLWRATWDFFFAFGSFLIAAILGIMLGNLIRGIPLDETGEYLADLPFLFNPFALLVGCFTVVLFALHGSIFILMKTDGAFHDQMRKLVNPLIILFILLYVITTVATLIYQPHMAETIKERPFFFLIALVHMLAIANIPRSIYKGKDFYAFLSSSANIFALLVLYAIGTYPNVVRAINDPKTLSLTIYNSSSSKMTLEILLLMAFIGVPLVISYTITVYWIFRGKVKLETHSY